MTSTACAFTPLDSHFLQRVLTPYRDHCRYLQSAAIQVTDDGSWVSCGQFSIAQSCYIDDTGHFNAVEFNICYNQLAYVHLAACIQQQTLPALSAFTLESFFDKQLSNYLIHSIESQYHTPIDPRSFTGEVRVVSARKRGKLAILRTQCRFFDSSGGRSEGSVKLAVLDP